jgi:hypothetical protein
MLKTVLMILVVLGFAWGYPPTRARMLHAAEPVLVRLGPLGKRIALPVQRYSTGQELEFILNQILLARTEGKETPDPKTFQRWLSKRVLTKNNGSDPWGHSYYLVRSNGGTLVVGSVGPDGQSGTADDLNKSIPF